MESIKCGAVKVAYIGSGCVNFGGAAGKEWTEPIDDCHRSFQNC